MFKITGHFTAIKYVNPGEAEKIMWSLIMFFLLHSAKAAWGEFMTGVTYVRRRIFLKHSVISYICSFCVYMCLVCKCVCLCVNYTRVCACALYAIVDVRLICVCECWGRQYTARKMKKKLGNLYYERSVE